MLDDFRSMRSASDFLSCFDEMGLTDLAAEAEEVRCAPGEVLVRAGEEANRLFLLLEGRLEVLAQAEETAEGAALGEIRAGEVVGEVALFSGGPRSATVRALETCRLAGFTRTAFGRLLERYPEISAHLAKLSLLRLRRTQLTRWVGRLLGPLAGEQQRDLEAEVRWRTLPSGATLFRQGEPGDSACVVVSGRLRVAVESAAGAPRVVAEVGRGEMVGEMALLTGDRRSATVYAIRDSELAVLPRDGFERLIHRHPPALTAISRVIVHRLAAQMTAGPKAPRTLTTLALLAAGPEVPLDGFARDLTAALAPFGAVTRLTSAGVDAALDKPGISQSAGSEDSTRARLLGWLNEQEALHRFVLYQADPGVSAWSDLCVRQADGLLMVADAGAAPEPGPLEAQLADRWPPARAPERVLVLLAGDRSSVATSRWLAGRVVDAHYHLRPGSAPDLARLARCLTGNAVGLVLGGGGARGFAHIGVLRALEEVGVPVDLIGGTSMGAIVAAFHALGWSAAEILERAPAAFGGLRDFTFPAVALIRGRRIRRRSRELFGEREIEDLQIPYFAVSTNLTRAEEVVHHRGSLADALRASFALPGVLPPAQRGGDLLVDGGLLNNVPIDVMRRQRGAGAIVAVDVSPGIDLAVDPRQGSELSGWSLLWDRLRPAAGRARAPGILSLLVRATVIGSTAARNRARPQADLYLDIPLRKWGMLEIAALEAIAECGYSTTVGAIRAWDAGRRGGQETA